MRRFRLIKCAHTPLWIRVTMCHHIRADIEERVELQGCWLRDLVRLDSLTVAQELDRYYPPLPSFQWMHTLIKTLKHLTVALYHSHGVWMRPINDKSVSLSFTAVHLDELFPCLEILSCGYYKSVDAVDVGNGKEYKSTVKTEVPLSVFLEWKAHLLQSLTHLCIAAPKIPGHPFCSRLGSDSGGIKPKLCESLPSRLLSLGLRAASGAWWYFDTRLSCRLRNLTSLKSDSYYYLCDAAKSAGDNVAAPVDLLPDLRHYSVGDWMYLFRILIDFLPSSHRKDQGPSINRTQMFRTLGQLEVLSFPYSDHKRQLHPHFFGLLALACPNLLALTFDCLFRVDVIPFHPDTALEPRLDRTYYGFYSTDPSEFPGDESDSRDLLSVQYPPKLRIFKAHASQEGNFFIWPQLLPLPPSLTTFSLSYDSFPSTCAEPCLLQQVP